MSLPLFCTPGGVRCCYLAGKAAGFGLFQGKTQEGGNDNEDKYREIIQTRKNGFVTPATKLLMMLLIAQPT